MNCSNNKCRGTCDQGRLCDDSHRATRDAWGVDDDMWIGPALVLIAIIFVIFVSGFIDALSIYLFNN